MVNLTIRENQNQKNKNQALLLKIIFIMHVLSTEKMGIFLEIVDFASSSLFLRLV